MRDQIENNLLCVIQQVKELETRAERSDALLADERERVATLQRELADLERRLPTEHMVQSILRDFFQADAPALAECLRRHLLPSQPAPQRDPPTVIEFCMRTDEAEALKRIGEKQELTEQQVLRQALRLYEPTVFPVVLPPKSQPEPIPEGVHWWEPHNNFYDINDRGMGVPFLQKWHSRRHEFPKSREEAERRGKPDEVMRLIDEVEAFCGMMTAKNLRSAITKEREACT